ADGTGGHTFTETYDQHQKNVARLRSMEKAVQNDTVEPPDDPPPAAAAATPADANPTAAAGKPPVPAKRTRTTTGRQGAAQSASPVVPQ
ncbi:MAG: hypothetical protein QOH32_1282, partial [Bradyrhizobium sp.]|nr:hypothetical protein [Bradyrhizobium sp.]